MSDALQSRPEPESASPTPDAILDRCSTIAFADSLVEIVRATETDINRGVLQLRLVEGRSVEESASECELTPEQVRKRTYHLLQRLRELAQYFSGSEFQWNEES